MSRRMKGCSWAASTWRTRSPGDHEVVVGDGVLDAQALQLAVAVGGADALQAARGFGFGLRRRIALFDLVEAGDALGDRRRRHLGARRRGSGRAHLEPHRRGLDELATDVGELVGVVELLEVRKAGVEGEVGLEGIEVVAGQVGADRQGGALAGGHRVDRRLGRRDGVAAGEDAGGLGAAGELVGLEGAPGREAELVVGVAHVGGVVGRVDHAAGRHDEARATLGAQLAVGAGRQGDALDAGRLAVAIDGRPSWPRPRRRTRRPRRRAATKSRAPAGRASAP